MNKINSCDNIQAGYDYPDLSKYYQPKLQIIHIGKEKNMIMINFVCDVCGASITPVTPDDEAVAYLTMGYALPITNDFAIHLRPKHHIYLCYDCMCKVNSTLLEMGWKPKKQEEPNGGK